METQHPLYDWLEESELTFPQKPLPMLLWLLYRGTGCNITSVAKKIYLRFDPSFITALNPFANTDQTPTSPARQAGKSSMKFHTLSRNKWDMADSSPQGIQSNSNRETVVVFNSPAVVPHKSPGAPNHPKYQQICYSHLISPAEQQHRMQATDDCDELTPLDEHYGPTRTISLQTFDGQHHPLTESQIYAIAGPSHRPALFSHSAVAGLSSPPTLFAQAAAEEERSAYRTLATQTLKNSIARRDQQVYSVLVTTDKSLPKIDSNGETVRQRAHNENDGSTPKLTQECSSHYWNARQDYVDNDLTPDLHRTNSSETVVPHHASRLKGESRYVTFRDPCFFDEKEQTAQAAPETTVYYQRSGNSQSGFNNAINVEDERTEVTRRSSTGFHFPTIFFYHY